MLDGLCEKSDTFPYLHVLVISPRTMKSNLMPVEDSLALEGSYEDINENDSISNVSYSNGRRRK